MPEQPPSPMTHRFTESEVHELTDPGTKALLASCFADVHHGCGGNPVGSYNLCRIGGILSLEPSSITLEKELWDTSTRPQHHIDTACCGKLSASRAVQLG